MDVTRKLPGLVQLSGYYLLLAVQAGGAEVEGRSQIAQLKCTHITGDELWGGTPQSEGLRAAEILHSAPRGAGYDEAHLKCFYTNTPYKEQARRA